MGGALGDTTGSSPSGAAQSWATAIKSGQASMAQVPAELRNDVASALSVSGGGDVTKTREQLTFLKDTVSKAIERSGAAGASGISRYLGDKFIGDTSYRQLESLTNTLRTNVLALMTDPTVKKFFGPQMSNADVQLMTAAGTTLNPELQSPELMKAELSRLASLFARIESTLPTDGAQQVGGVGAAQEVDVRAPDGTIGTIPASQLDAALAEGYTKL